MVTIDVDINISEYTSYIIFYMFKHHTPLYKNYICEILIDKNYLL